MRIVVDIGHPAHVHLFKYFISEMRRKGHEILVTAADKDVALELLDDYQLDYIPVGRTGRSLFKKILSVPVLDWNMYHAVKSFDPDLLIGMASIRCTHVARLLGKKSIIVNDTEATIKEHIMYYPFADYILSPRCFGRDFGKKHIRYDGYQELAYLHPNRFQPNPETLKELILTENDPFFIVRLIAFEATHDKGKKGFSNEGKIRLVKELEKHGRVIIASEGELTEELKPYQMRISPTKIHDLLYYAKLYIGEGLTMASEAAVLGTPVVFYNTFSAETIKEQTEKYKLMYTAADQEDVLAQVEKCLAKDNLKETHRKRAQKMLKEKIDVTAMLVEFVEEKIAGKG